MKNGSIHLVDLEFEYKIWKKRLNAFLAEVDILLDRNIHLTPEKKRNALNSIELIALEEHKDSLEKLKNKIEIKEQELTFYNKDFPITEEHEYFLEHLEMRKLNDRTLQIHIDRVNDIVHAIGA